MIDRAKRIADNPKVGRPEARAAQAGQARAVQEAFVEGAEFRGGIIGGATSSRAGELGQKLNGDE